MVLNNAWLSTSSDDEEESYTSSTSSGTIYSDESHEEGTLSSNVNSVNSKTFCTFEVGDHVYHWGPKCMFSHHGIVIEVSPLKGEVTIFDFSCTSNEDDGKQKSGQFLGLSYSVSMNKSSKTKRAENERLSELKKDTIDISVAMKEWHKVQYNITFKQSLLKRAGTFSKATSDPVEIILARAFFLLDNDVLPKYDLTEANCEHVAVWCKTGKFCSLQVSNVIGKAIILTVVKDFSASVATVIATTTVPASGVMGWIGFTTTVPLTTALPWLLPVTMVYGAASTAKNVHYSYLLIKTWKETTKDLNEKYEDRKL